MSAIDAERVASEEGEVERKQVEEKKQVEEEQVKEKPLRKIDDELYERLRRKTPSSSIRKAVNKGVVLPMNDFALSGLKITTPLQADRIVSMDKISRMEGFDKLSFKDTSEEIEICPEFREKMIDRENQLTKDL